MTAEKWWQRSCLSWDLEATGVDPFNDRIITAAVVHLPPPGQGRPRTISWMIDPGIDVPTGAAEIHGWTTDKLRTALAGAEATRTLNGVTRPLTRDGALFEITAQLATAIGTETAVIGFNIPYDATLLEAECRRHDVPAISERPHGWVGMVDGLVIDKAREPYRPGKCDGQQKRAPRCTCGADGKKLVDLCRHHRVPITAAHDAGADALAAARLAVKLVSGWPDVARLKLTTLHDHQVGWRQEQADSLRAYFDKNGIEHDGVPGDWPLLPQAVAA